MNRKFWTSLTVTVAAGVALLSFLSRDPASRAAAAARTNDTPPPKEATTAAEPPNRSVQPTSAPAPEVERAGSGRKAK